MQLPAKLSRYAAVATLLLKHRSAMDDQNGDDAEQLAKDLETLGPTFVKLGQLLVRTQRPAAAGVHRRPLAIAGRRGAVPLRRRRADRLGRELVRAYLHQIVVDGFFHADPHPGNVFVTDDKKLALVDLGMVGRLSARTQDRLLELLMAASEGRGDEAADVLIDLGRRRDNFDEVALRRDVVALVAQFQQSSLADLQIGRMLLEVNQRAGMHGLKPPPDLTLLGKTLLNLDTVARSLAPKLDVNAAIREQAVTLMRQRMLHNMSPGRVLSTVLEAKQFAERLPGRVNKVLDALAGNELKLKMELIDEGAIIDGLQKVANRVALGLVMAALIVAAALIMQVPTTFRLLGYPGLAMILFVIAAGAGAMLAVQIINHDRSAHRRRM